MLSFTHLLFCETVINWNPIRIQRKLVNRFPSWSASLQFLKVLEYSYRKADAKLNGNELQIFENEKICKRWIIVEAVKELELQLED